MVSKNQPDWLPSGWKLLTKLKNNRKYKIYVHSKTSLKVYSRLAVLRCIKNGSVGNDSSNSAKVHANVKRSIKEQKPQLVAANDSMKWLPSGWSEEVKIRQSGGTKGTPYKCFTDPSSGSKFYSKPEVLRHLQSTQNSAGPSGREERRSTRHSSSNRGIDQQMSQESNVELKMSQISKTTPSRKHSSGKKESRGDQQKAQESNIEQNVLPNSNTPASRGLSLRNKESRGDQQKAQESNIEQNVLPNSKTPASRRLSLRNKESQGDQQKAQESNIEQNVLPNSNTPTSRRLSLRNKEMPVDQRKTQESNVEQNTPASRGLSLQNKEMPVDQQMNRTVQESNVEQNVLQNSNIPANRRLSLRNKERPIEQQKPQKSNVKSNLSQDSKTAVSTRFSSGKRKIVIENTVDKDLPSGWIKEMRKRFSGTKVRADPFYFHPASGLVFRSKREVLRYLNTGEISRHAYRRRNNVDKEDCTVEKTSPTLLVKRETPAKRKTRSENFTGEETPKENPSSTPEIRVVNEATVGRITRSSSSRFELASISETKPNHSSLFHKIPNISKETIKTTNDQKMTPFTPAMGKLTVENTATCSMKRCSNKKGQITKKTKDQTMTPSTPATSKLTVESAVAGPMKGCSNKKAQTTKRIKNDQKTPRSSKRLAGVDVQPVFLSIPIEHALRSTSKKSEEPKPIANSVSVLNHLQDMPNPPDPIMHNVPVCEPTKPSSLEASPETVLAREEPLNNSDSLMQSSPPPLNNSDSLMQSSPPPLNNSDSLMQSSPPVVSENALIDVVLPNTDQPSEILRNHPILEEQQPDVFLPSGAEFSFPPPLWSDPCLEFAYKTLTGAIPLDDNLAIEDYIQHQLRTSKPRDEFQSLPDIDMPSFLQSDETKHGQLPDINMPDGVRLPNGNGLPPPTKQASE